jgi:hypothetical protein
MHPNVYISHYGLYPPIVRRVVPKNTLYSKIIQWALHLLKSASRYVHVNLRGT